MLQIKDSKVRHHDPDDKEFKFGKMVISVFPEGEGIIENLENRRCRPVAEFRKVLPEALKQVAGDLLITEEQAEMLAKTAKWSQKAGCNCGCSPGFKVDLWNRASMCVTVVAKQEEQKQ